ncbi:MAG: hypothetical protein Q7L55_09840 [Actinomycetota bacterium]|nr:hypothetical protein [Actinomycetota bacterium]
MRRAYERQLLEFDRLWVSRVLTSTMRFERGADSSDPLLWLPVTGYRLPDAVFGAVRAAHLGNVEYLQIMARDRRVELIDGNGI